MTLRAISSARGSPSAADSTLPLGFTGTASQLEAQVAATTAATLRYVPGAGQYPTFGFNINNSDTTIWITNNAGAQEYRGNTHGGETGATGTYTTDVQVFLDYGDGNGFVGPYLAQNTSEWWNNVYRVKIVVNTVLAQSTGPQFATIAKTYYLYNDGTLRYDRTFTFTANQVVNKWFWHMSSFAPTAGSSSYRGRLGQGLHVLRQVDDNAYLATPALTGVPTVTGSGGSIPANVDPNTKYSVRITAMTESGGETTGSIPYALVHVTTAGSTIAPTWSAVTGASNYGIYFGPWASSAGLRPSQ